MDRARTLGVAALLAALLLAGCVQIGGPATADDDGATDGDAGRYASFGDVLGAPGPVLEPAGDAPLRLKLLDPEVGTPGGAQREVVVAVLALDGGSGGEDGGDGGGGGDGADGKSQPGPVLDATVRLAGGPVTAAEDDATVARPLVHDAHGVYVGQGPWGFDGTWLLEFIVEGADAAGGDAVAFPFPPGGLPGASFVPTFDSFEEAFGAEGRVIHPHDGERTAAEWTMADDVGLDYANATTFSVGSRFAWLAEVRVLFRPTTPLDQVNATLLSPDGTVARAATLDSAKRSVAWRFLGPAQGQWRLELSGRGVLADVEAHGLVLYDLPIKVLHPPDLRSGPPGRQALVLLPHDEFPPGPVPDAAVTARAQHLGTGRTLVLAAPPEHVGNGVYVGLTPFDMPGTWRLDLRVELPTGLYYDYKVDLEVG